MQNTMHSAWHRHYSQDTLTLTVTAYRGARWGRAPCPPPNTLPHTQPEGKGKATQPSAYPNLALFLTPRSHCPGIPPLELFDVMPQTRWNPPSPLPGPCSPKVTKHTVPELALKKFVQNKCVPPPPTQTQTRGNSEVRLATLSCPVLAGRVAFLTSPLRAPVLPAAAGTKPNRPREGGKGMGERAEGTPEESSPVQSGGGGCQLERV